MVSICVDVLSDAQVYSEHACKATIDCDDVKLAIQRKVNFSFPQSPPRELVHVRACFFIEHYLKGLTLVIRFYWSWLGPGVALPPEQDALICPNYQLAIPKKKPTQVTEEMVEDEEPSEPNPPQEPEPSGVPQNTPQWVSFQCSV
ncbi:hypothetical protein DVH24_030415 [Malus domestica]|uniref:Transcription factor CBF/NF-Y/archaeal histone domain-containing protein n=1 Tax=Malus domestica TaxID=3750 RepID=A0A498KQ63_MALDO|nr:hypothetical protein DVH24_030415 [Malus domestica]